MTVECKFRRFSAIVWTSSSLVLTLDERVLYIITMDIPSWIPQTVQDEVLDSFSWNKKNKSTELILNDGLFLTSLSAFRPLFLWPYETSGCCWGKRTKN